MSDPCTGFRRDPDGTKVMCRLPWDHDGTCTFPRPDDKHGSTLVAVSPEVARLIEAVGADHLPALLRVAWAWWGDEWGDFVLSASDAVPLSTWERLGEALGGGS